MASIVSKAHNRRSVLLSQCFGLMSHFLGLPSIDLNVICIKLINDVIEKVYALISFWLCFLSIITSMAVIYRFLTIILEEYALES